MFFLFLAVFVIYSSFKYLASFCYLIVELGSISFRECYYCILERFTLVKTETFSHGRKNAPSQSLFLRRDVEEIFTKAIGRGGGCR